MVGTERIVIYALGIGLGYATLAQGAFYAEQYQTVLVAFGIAALAQLRRRMFPSGRAWRCAILAPIALSGWSAIAGTHAGDITNAYPLISLCLCLSVGLTCTATLSNYGRELFLSIVIALGVIVGISCWYGVVFHHEPFALPSQKVWRAASTLTYANATAAFLLAPIAIGVRRVVQGDRNVATLVGLWVIAVGWGLTFSRGGVLGLAVGGAYLLLFGHQRRQLIALWPVAAGAAITISACIPSLSEGKPSHPAIAIVGVLVGIALVVASPIKWTRVGVLVGLAVFVVGGVTVVGASSILGATDQIVATRVDAKSSDRSDLNRVTWNQFADHPLMGVGPGNIDFDYVNHNGVPVHAEFTHNEYLQLAAEIGVVGLIILIFGMVIFVVAVPRRREWPGAAAVALFAGFAIHASLDFLTHIPVLPLIILMTASTLAKSNDPVEELSAPIS